jgi:hypothetical protein
MEADILSNMRFLNKKKSLPQNPNPSLQIRGGMEADILSNMRFLNKKNAPPKSKSEPPNPNPRIAIRASDCNPRRDGSGYLEQYAFS